MTFLSEITRSKDPSSGNVRRKTKKIPQRPPKILKNDDSNKNCIKMKYFFAPRDFWSPIIGTLSLTETNIILSIPNPPTRIEKLPITQPAILIVENIVETKGALFHYLENGISFINYADERVKSINNSGDKVTYGLNEECDFPADIHHDDDGSILLTIDAQEIKTKSKNLSFVKNIIAVSAVSVTLEIEWELLQERILTFKPPKGRCKVLTYNSITIIDDTYNANLESCVAAIDYLMAFTGSGRKILVLGDMLELGVASTQQHEKLGSKCSEANLDAVFTIGKETMSTQSVINGVPINLHYHNSDDLISSWKSQLKDNDKVLFKGSRGMKMEKIISGVFEA